MTCKSVDWKAYVLGELDRRELPAYENHLTACQGCREELDRLKLTQTALFSLPDEEIPQRIAFVSDKVFEPRWWQVIWRSGPVMGFASAAMLAGAILVHGYTRPAPQVTPSGIDTAAIQQRIDQQVAERVQSAVITAVAEVEKREEAKNAKILAAAEQRFQVQRQADLAAARQTVDLFKNQLGRMMWAANYTRSQP